MGDICAKLKQWLQRKRERKCERDGHLLEGKTRRVYVTPSEGYRGVADSVFEEKIFCRRCGHVESDWHEYRRSTLHSLTLPGDWMAQLEEEGRFVING